MLTRALCLAVPVLGAIVASAQSTDLLVDTVAGNGQPGAYRGDGVALQTVVDQPFGVELGPDGALYITSVGQHRVLRLDRRTGQLTSVAGNGQKGHSGDAGPATAAELNEPYEVRFDSAGNMLFVEMQNHLVRRVDAATGTITTIAGDGTPGFAGDDGPAAKARFRQPHSIALDDRGMLYVADIGNHRIRRIDLKKGTITTIAGNGQRDLPRDGEVAQGKPMVGPRALFITGRTMWIALREGHSVWRMDLDSLVVRHVAGTGQQGYTGDGGPGSKATFNGPKGITASPAGIVYVVDTENQVIRAIGTKADRVSTIAGAGPAARGYGGDDGPALQARFDRPHGIGLAPDGSLFLGDTNNHRVRWIHR